MAFEDPVKTRARSLMSQAVIHGILKRSEECELCGFTEHIHGHHDDYDQPLKVQWLCRDCHHAVHSDDKRTADPCRALVYLGAKIKQLVMDHAERKGMRPDLWLRLAAIERFEREWHEMNPPKKRKKAIKP